MLAARQEARRNFDQNRRVGIDTGMQINHAIEVANLLRHNLVQGAREEADEAAKWGAYNLNPSGLQSFIQAEAKDSYLQNFASTTRSSAATMTLSRWLERTSRFTRLALRSPLELDHVCFATPTPFTMHEHYR